MRYSLVATAGLALLVCVNAAGAQDQPASGAVSDAIQRAAEPAGALPQPLTPPDQAASRAPDTTAAGTAAAPKASATEAAPGAASSAPGSQQSAATADRTLDSLKVEAVNAAAFTPEMTGIKGANPLVLKLQVLLDRANASPGVIDAFDGENVAKAIAAVQAELGLPVDGVLTPQVWQALGGDNAARPPLTSYEITADDVKGPFLTGGVPTDYAELAKLKSVAYTGPVEMFGERFHMDTDLLKALNAGKDFGNPGTKIVVADVQSRPIAGKVARIEADKTHRQLRAYDENNKLVVAYPATIGSEDNPSPSGEHKINGVAKNPIYYYDPSKNFKQGKNSGKLEIPPGPNNPVGTVWIDLSEPTYGIHGTPEPSRIDKTGSHGCIRLTNWDVEELAKLVKPGVTVSFVGDGA